MKPVLDTRLAGHCHEESASDQIRKTERTMCRRVDRRGGPVSNAGMAETWTDDSHDRGTTDESRVETGADALRYFAAAMAVYEFWSCPCLQHCVALPAWLQVLSWCPPAQHAICTPASADAAKQSVTADAASRSARTIGNVRAMEGLESRTTPSVALAAGCVKARSSISSADRTESAAPRSSFPARR